MFRSAVYNMFSNLYKLPMKYPLTLVLGTASAHFIVRNPKKIDEMDIGDMYCPTTSSDLTFWLPIGTAFAFVKEKREGPKISGPYRIPVLLVSNIISTLYINEMKEQLKRRCSHGY